MFPSTLLPLIAMNKSFLEILLELNSILLKLISVDPETETILTP
jgi:hypothetical protein